jgi:hypothetical protein
MEETMKKERMTLITLGDIILHGDEPETMFDHVIDVLRSGDIVFANCDQTYSDKGYNSSRGFADSSGPKNIPALIHAGLDVVSLANNHTLDWGYDNLLDTLERLSKTDIKVVGVGKNLAEARQPVIKESKGNRVGFLAYGCIGPDSYEAWEDKPGYAPMRAWTIYDKWDYQPGTPPRIVTLAYRDDLAAMEEDVRKLKSQVDVVAVSFHWGLHFQHAVIPMYEFEVGHAAIDAGADIIIGGHAHILKGIEVYKGKVIFHAMNNFAVGGIRHATGGEQRPRGWDFARGGKLFAERYHFTPETGSIWHPEYRKTLMGKVLIEDGKIQKVSYIPCYINKNDQPEMVTRNTPRGQEVFSYVEQISREQDLSVNFAWEGDEVLISP